MVLFVETRVTLFTSHGSFIHNDGIAVAATSDLMT